MSASGTEKSDLVKPMWEQDLQLKDEIAVAWRLNQDWERTWQIFKATKDDNDKQAQIERKQQEAEKAQERCCKNEKTTSKRKL